MKETVKYFRSGKLKLRREILRDLLPAELNAVAAGYIASTEGGCSGEQCSVQWCSVRSTECCAGQK
jgi:hypothetical protein